MFSKLKKKERKGHSTMELDLPSPWSPIPRCSHHGIGPKFSSFRLALIQHSAHMCNKFQIFNTFYKFIIDLHKIIDLQYLLYMLLNFIKFIHIFLYIFELYNCILWWSPRSNHHQYILFTLLNKFITLKLIIYFKIIISKYIICFWAKDIPYFRQGLRLCLVLRKY